MLLEPCSGNPLHTRRPCPSLGVSEATRRENTKVATRGVETTTAEALSVLEHARELVAHAWVPWAWEFVVNHNRKHYCLVGAMYVASGLPANPAETAVSDVPAGLKIGIDTLYGELANRYKAEPFTPDTAESVYINKIRCLASFNDHCISNYPVLGLFHRAMTKLRATE